MTKVVAKANEADGILVTGRLLVAMALAVFGVQGFLQARLIVPLMPEWVPAPYFFACYMPAVFFAAALSIVSTILAQVTAGFLGLMCLMSVAITYMPMMANRSREPILCTRGFVLLATAGCAYIVAGSFAKREAGESDLLGMLGRILLGGTMVYFGLQNFAQARFGEGIAPPWAVGDAVWMVLAGIALLGVGAAMLFGIKTRPAAMLLSVGTFLYVLIYFVPRIATHVQDQQNWMWAFEILTISGGALVLSRMDEVGGVPTSTP